jgi:hypothetical protein
MKRHAFNMATARFVDGLRVRLMFDTFVSYGEVVSQLKFKTNLMALGDNDFSYT